MLVMPEGPLIRGGMAWLGSYRARDQKSEATHPDRVFQLL
jgi:hypothetical protein